MIRLFQFLIHGCAHEWEDVGMFTQSNEYSSGPAVSVRCKKCGRRSWFWGGDEMSEELKPCRFCQGINSEARFNPLEDYTWRVFCLEPGCRARGPRRETRREAIAAWNTRTPADARAAFEQAVREAAADARLQGGLEIEKAMRKEIAKAVEAERERCAQKAGKVVAAFNYLMEKAKDPETFWKREEKRDIAANIAAAIRAPQETSE